MNDTWTAFHLFFDEKNSQSVDDVMGELAERLEAAGAGELENGHWAIYFSGSGPHDFATEALEILSQRGVRLLRRPEIENVQQQNWNEAWKEFYHPVKVTDRITVLPSWLWMGDKADAEINILIEPGMAFGTGTHETTQLCMRLTEQFVKPGDVVLDAGTGTGILAVAALKLGARLAVGFDIDPDISENASINLALNNSGPDKILVYVGSLDVTRPGLYDLVLCNMLSTQFLPILSDLIARCKPHAPLLLSGMLETEEPEVRAAVEQQGWKVVHKEVAGMWSSFACRISNTA